MCAALLAACMLAGCSESAPRQTREDEETVETEQSGQSEQTEPSGTQEKEPADETEQTSEPAETVAEPVSECVDLSNLYGARLRLPDPVWHEHLCDSCAMYGMTIEAADSWGVYIFPECEITITGEYEEYSPLYERNVTKTAYTVNYPVMDTGTGYEFNCSICYPDIVSSEGSLSGREYTLISEDWNVDDPANPGNVNPRCSCTYSAWDGNTYSVGMLNDPSQNSFVYDANGNPAFIIMENVRVYIPYENAGDLYDRFIGPALAGTMEGRGYGAAECFKVSFDADGVITVSDEVYNHIYYDRGYLIYYSCDNAHIRFTEGHPALYAVPSYDDCYISFGMENEDPISNGPPDFEVLFEVPLTVTEQ